MKKVFFAFMAMAALVFLGCNNNGKDNKNGAEENKIPSALTAHYGDTIIAHLVMPDYNDYEVTIDNDVQGIVSGDTVFVQCVGQTVIHITADKTNKHDVALTVEPVLTEEMMFKLPSLDWTRTAEQVEAELGEPNNTSVAAGDLCYIYYLDDDYNQYAYYYFDPTTKVLKEILISISDEYHGLGLKWFIAERFVYYNKTTQGKIDVYFYHDYNGRNHFRASTMIRYYYMANTWNVSFMPNPEKQ